VQEFTSERQREFESDSCYNPPMPVDSPAPLLVLIGFMGAGKSTLGRLLASELGCPLIDLDVEISRTHGPIPDLFSSRGESGFRAIEHYHLGCVLPNLARPSVLALGGGAFLQPANRELLARHSATVIFLDAPFEVLRARIAETGYQRPLVRDLERLHDLFEQRRPTYLLAHHTFDASSTSPTELLTSLVRLANCLGISTSARDKL
jgi:shikimate kinase